MAETHEKEATDKINNTLRNVVMEELEKNGIIAVKSNGKLRIDNLPMACRIVFKGMNVYAQFLTNNFGSSSDWKTIMVAESKADSLADPNYDPQLAVKRVVKFFNTLNDLREFCNIDIEKIPLRATELKKMLNDEFKKIFDELKIPIRKNGDLTGSNEMRWGLSANGGAVEVSIEKDGNNYYSDYFEIFGYFKKKQLFLFEGYPEDGEIDLEDDIDDDEKQPDPVLIPNLHDKLVKMVTNVYNMGTRKARLPRR